MTASLVQQVWFRWALAIILGFPLLTFLLNEAIVWLRRGQKPLAETLSILRNLLLPILALLIFLREVLEVGEGAIAARLLRTLLWIVAIHAALSALKVLVFEEAAAGSWQEKVPSLLLDLLRFFLVACVAALVLSSVWKVDLGGLLTALGVGSLVIGLALQDSLKNLFSGILLLFERPFTLGDWLQVGDTIGKVVQVNWRSVYLQPRDRSLVVIPNSVLAQGKFANYSRPTSLHLETFSFSFSYDDPPNRAKAALRETALATAGILQEPEPWVSVTGYGDFAINYQIGFFLNDYEDAPQIRNQFVSRVWYAARRHQLTIPYPIQTEYQIDTSQLSQPEPSARVAEALSNLPHCNHLASQVLEKGSAASRTYHYARGETLLREGEQPLGLYLVLQGEVALLVRDGAGREQEIVRLSRGEFFAEKALLGRQPSEVSALALEDVEVAVLEADAVLALLERMPRLSREFSELIRTRRQEVEKIKHQHSPFTEKF